MDGHAPEAAGSNQDKARAAVKQETYRPQ